MHLSPFHKKKSIHLQKKMNENPQLQFDILPKPYCYIAEIVKELIDVSWNELRDRALNPSIGRFRQTMRSVRLSGCEGGQQALLYSPIIESIPKSLSFPKTSSSSSTKLLFPRVTSLSATRLLRVRDAVCGNLALVGTSDGEILFVRRDQLRDTTLTSDFKNATLSNSNFNSSVALRIKAFRLFKQQNEIEGSSNYQQREVLPFLTSNALDTAKLSISSISLSFNTGSTGDTKSLLPSTLLHPLEQTSSVSMAVQGKAGENVKIDDTSSQKQIWKDALYFAGGVTVLPEITCAPAPDYFSSSSSSSASSSSSSSSSSSTSTLVPTNQSSTVGFVDTSATNSEKDLTAKRLGLSAPVTYAIPIWSKREELRGFLVACASVAVASSEKAATTLSTSLAIKPTKASTIPSSPSPASASQTRPPTKGTVAVPKPSDTTLATEVSDALNRQKEVLSPFMPTGVIRIFHVPREVLIPPPPAPSNEKASVTQNNSPQSKSKGKVPKPRVFSTYDTEIAYNSSLDLSISETQAAHLSTASKYSESKFDSKFDHNEDEDEDDDKDENDMKNKRSDLYDDFNETKEDSLPQKSLYIPPVRWVASVTLPLGILAAKVEVSIDGRFLSVLCSDAHVRVYHIHPSAMTPPPPEPPRESESAALIRIAAEKAQKEDEEEELLDKLASTGGKQLVKESPLIEKVSLHTSTNRNAPLTFPPLPLPPPLELDLVCDLTPPTLDSISSSLSSSSYFLSPHSSGEKTSHETSNTVSRSAAALAAAGGARQVSNIQTIESTDKTPIPLLIGFHFTATRSFTPDINDQISSSNGNNSAEFEKGSSSGSIATTSARSRGGQSSLNHSSSSSSSSFGPKTTSRTQSIPHSPHASSSPISSSSSSSSTIRYQPKNSPGHDGIPVTDGCIIWWTVDKTALGGSSQQAKAAQDNLRCVFRHPLNIKTLLESPPLSSTFSSSGSTVSRNKITNIHSSSSSSPLFTPLPFAPTSSCIFPNLSSYHHIMANTTSTFPSATSPLLLIGDEGGSVSAFELGVPSNTASKGSVGKTTLSSMTSISMSPGALVSRGILGRHTFFPSFQATLAVGSRDQALLMQQNKETEKMTEIIKTVKFDEEQDKSKNTLMMSDSTSLSTSARLFTPTATVTALAISACCRWAVSGSAAGQVFIYDLRQALLSKDDGVLSRLSLDPLLSFPSSSSSSSSPSATASVTPFSSGKSNNLGLVGGSLLSSLSSNKSKNQTDDGRTGGWQRDGNTTSEAGVVLKLPCHVLSARWDGNGSIKSLRMLLDAPIALAEVEEWPTTKRGDLMQPDLSLPSTEILKPNTTLYAYDVPAGILMTVVRPSDKTSTNAFINATFGTSGKEYQVNLSTVKPLEPDGFLLGIPNSTIDAMKQKALDSQKASAAAIVSNSETGGSAIRNIFVPPSVLPKQTKQLSAELAPSLSHYALWCVFADGLLLSTSASTTTNIVSSSSSQTFVHSLSLRGLFRSGYPVLERAFLRAGIVPPILRAGSARSQSQLSTQGGGGGGGGGGSRSEDTTPSESIIRSAYAAQLYASLSFNDRSLGRNVASSILAGPDAQALTSRLVDQRAMSLLESSGHLGGGGGGENLSSSLSHMTISANATASLVSISETGSLSPPPLIMHTRQGEDDEELTLDDNTSPSATFFSTNTDEISRNYVEERYKTHEARDARLNVRAQTTAKLLGRETRR
jgi:hypothetical protein